MAKSEDLVYRLKTKEAKVVTVKVSNDKQTLYAKEEQDKNGQRVYIAEKTIEGAKCMAFIFQCGNAIFLPKVEDRKLQLKQLPNDYYFKKYNDGSGDHYGLQSVVNPDLYICERADKSFFLSLKNGNLVHVKNEKIH